MLRIPREEVEVYVLVGRRDKYLRVLDRRFDLEIVYKSGLGQSMSFVDNVQQVVYETDYPNRWHQEAVSAKCLRILYRPTKEELLKKDDGTHDSCRECLLYIS